MTDSCKYQLIAPVSAGESDDLLEGKSQDEGLRRVQALLADWLRMENVVVLTAAGCSVGAGGRLECKGLNKLGLSRRLSINRNVFYNTEAAPQLLKEFRNAATAALKKSGPWDHRGGGSHNDARGHRDE